MRAGARLPPLRVAFFSTSEVEILFLDGTSSGLVAAISWLGSVLVGLEHKRLRVFQVTVGGGI